MDLVGYSKLPMEEQLALIQKLEKVVIETETVRKAKPDGQLILRSIGDGMALVFFGDPCTGLQCAKEITLAIRETSEIKIRMGIHTGPAYRRNNINNERDVIGDAINTAQRVMDCADANHILVSRAYADVLREFGDNKKSLFSLGQIKIKHGATLNVFNFSDGQIGNREKPKKFRNRYRSILLLVGCLLAGIAIGQNIQIKHPQEIDHSESTRAKLAFKGGQFSPANSGETGGQLNLSFEVSTERLLPGRFSLNARVSNGQFKFIQYNQQGEEARLATDKRSAEMTIIPDNPTRLKLDIGITESSTVTLTGSVLETNKWVIKVTDTTRPYPIIP